METPRTPIHVHAGWSHDNSSVGLFINYIGLGSQHSWWKKTN